VAKSKKLTVEGLAVVKRIKLSKLLLVTLHQISELVKENPALGVVHGAPLGTALEGVEGRVDGGIDVGSISLADMADGLASCGVDGSKSLARLAVNKLVCKERWKGILTMK
jgi:hypothetical protein